MANLDDLNNRSITEMNSDEVIEMLRQIRLSRRITKPKVKNTKKAKAPELNADMAAELLKILGGK